MKIGVEVLCRYSSSRLPGKILKEIGGKPILQHILDRLKQSTKIDSIVVTTSTDSSDDIISRYCHNNNLECFRGSLDNVSKRVLDCALKYQFDYFIRINGDNLFIDIELLDSMVDFARDGQYDFITNVPGRTFPYGMSIEILKTSFYKNIEKEFRQGKHKEHVTLYLYENEKLGRRKIFVNNKYPEGKEIKLALDTESDLKLLRQISRLLKDNQRYDLSDIIRIYKSIEK